MEDRNKIKNLQMKGDEKEMRKSEKGITLIALIITIIILVILAAVSIRAVYNMGIVGYTINGTQHYARGEVAENAMLGETTSKIDEAVAKVKEIQNGSSGNNSGGNGGNNNSGNTQNTEAPDLLKTYVLGAAVNGVRPGRDEEEIYDYDNHVFKNDDSSRSNASTVITYLNEIRSIDSYNIYIRYNNVAYKIVEDPETYKTTDVVGVYESEANSNVGKVVQYSVDGMSTATDWLVLYDNGTTLDITSLAEMGSYTLGYNDPNATTTLESTDANYNLSKAMNSYENAVTRLNTYCGTLVTNSTAQKVRSVGTQFDIADTSTYYSSDYLATIPTSDPGRYNYVANSTETRYPGKTGDMNGEQDVVRMSYYSAGETHQMFGYATTTNPYWLASHCVYGISGGAGFGVRCVDGGNANYGAYFWIVYASGAGNGNGTWAVRPVVRVAVGNVSGLD